MGRPRLVELAVAAALTLAGGCGLSLQSAPKFGSQAGPGYQVHAVFGNVLNLPDNAQVRDGSAVVGQVAAITAHDFHADLTFDIQRGVRLPVGTTAQVRFDSPLGDEFILLQPPGPPHAGPQGFLHDGATLSIAQTSTAPSVEDTLAALSAVLNGGGINQLETVVTQLNDTFSGNAPQIRGFLVHLDAWISALSAHRADLDNALAAVGSLSAQLDEGSGVITAGIDAIAPAVGVLANENADLQQLQTQLTQLSTAANDLIAQSGQASVRDVQQLLPVVDQLVGVEQQIGPDLQDIANFEASTPKVAPGNYLQVSLTLHALLNPAPATVDQANAFSGPAAPGRTRAVTALLEGGLP